MAEILLKTEVKSLAPSDVLAVETHFTKQFHVRMWIGMKLIHLATWVMGCSVRIEEGQP